MIVPRECTTRRMVTFTATIIITFITSKPDFAIRSISNPSDKNEFWISKNEASSDLFKSQSITKSGWWVESFNYRTLPVIKWPLFKSVAYWPRFCMICLSKYSALLCQYYIIHHMGQWKARIWQIWRDFESPGALRADADFIMLEETIFIGLSGDVQSPFQPQKYIFGHNNMNQTMEKADDKLGPAVTCWRKRSLL